LGPLEVRADGSLLPLNARKQKSILALLILHRGEVVSVDRLQEALWGEHPPTTAHTALQGYVSQLRRLLGKGEDGGGSLLVTRSPGYLFGAAPDQLDLTRFEQLTASGRKALAEGEPARAANLLAEALDLWRGPPLADFAYEAWAQAAIGRLEELRLSALEDRIEADLACGHHSELVGELEALIAEQPLRERLRGQLMLALYRGGRQADALDAYQAARRALVEELGIEPSPDLQSLNHSILNHDEALTAPPRAVAVDGPVKLPVPATPLVGRRRELAELDDLLRNEDTRLVTLTGPGGTGKTRLALRAAEEAAPSFPDGVHWVGLAALRDPSLVATTVAQACEVTEVLGASLTETIVRSFADKRALVLLDNCEHLADGVAELTAPLVEQCSRLVVIASSRERLGLRSEHVYAVPPMEEKDAEALFVKRARALQADFEPDEHIAAVCRAVDGLPLAVELAAARVRSLSTETIRERLNERLSLLTTRDRDVEERQRTLEATIAWSYELLDADERRAFRALSVFAGGCTLAAAEQVAGAELDLIESLLDKSLLRHRVDDAGQDRYWMLETLREFAARELGREEETKDAADRHAAWVFEFVREVAPAWGTRSEQKMFDRLLADEANIRIALTTAFEERDGDQALEVVGLIGRTWTFIQVGRLMEIRRWAQGALALGGEPHLEALALLALGWSDLAAGAESFAAAAERFQRAGMDREAAYALMSLGCAEGESGSVDRGLELLEGALAEFERIGDNYCESVTRWNILDTQSLRWPLEPSEARRLADTARESAEESRRLGATSDELSALDTLSHALIDAGDLAEGWSTAVYAATVFHKAHRGWGYAATLAGIGVALARAAALRANAEQSLFLAAGVRAISRELGLTLPVARVAGLEAAEVSAKAALDDDSAARAIAAGEASTVDSFLDYLATLR
jgi:predicted ATPase/DNA-binding SARP family transcriptional activator